LLREYEEHEYAIELDFYADVISEVSIPHFNHISLRVYHDIEYRGQDNT